MSVIKSIAQGKHHRVRSLLDKVRQFPLGMILLGAIAVASVIVAYEYRPTFDGPPTLEAQQNPPELRVSISPIPTAASIDISLQVCNTPSTSICPPDDAGGSVYFLDVVALFPKPESLETTRWTTTFRSEDVAPSVPKLQVSGLRPIPEALGLPCPHAVSLFNDEPIEESLSPEGACDSESMPVECANKYCSAMVSTAYFVWNPLSLYRSSGAWISAMLPGVYLDQGSPIPVSYTQSLGFGNGTLNGYQFTGLEPTYLSEYGPEWNDPNVPPQMIPSTRIPKEDTSGWSTRGILDLPITAENIAVEEQAGWRTFLSGASVGIFGAAIIALIVELLIHRKAKTAKPT